MSARAGATAARWPVYDEEQVEAAAAVLRSGLVNQWTGSEVERFEAEYAASLGVRRAVALANGTVALELALRALGIGPGCDVVVTPRSFVASALAVLTVGARPVFADVDVESQNLTPATIEAALTPATKAVIVVHLAGWPCAMAPIMGLAERRGLKVIEDCAQAHGATIDGRPVGSFGHVGVFSFCQDKIVTTGGEGGLLVTDDEEVWRRAWSYKDHGKDLDALARPADGPGFKWLHAHPGTNWRMTELQAALGRVQLRRLPGWLTHRRRVASAYARAFADHPALRVPAPPADVGHACYRFYAFVRPERLKPGWDRDRVQAEVAKRGVPCFTGSCPEIYREAVFTDRGLGPAERLPVAEELGRTSLALLTDPCQDDAAVARTVDAVLAVLDEAAL